MNSNILVLCIENIQNIYRSSLNRMQKIYIKLYWQAIDIMFGQDSYKSCSFYGHLGNPR